MKFSLPPKFKTVLIFTLLAGGVWVRTYRLQTPLADWHSWRQADTAAVARNFVKDGFNLFYPQSDSFWSLAKDQLDNPHRYFLNEFPFYNAIVALVYRQFGINHIYGRIVSIFFSVLGAFFLYLLTRQLFDYRIALLALVYYLFLPYNIYYGRVVMPDPTFVSFSVISLYWAVRWAESKKNRHGIFLALSLALAILVKPYAIFMVFPIFYWLLSRWGREYSFSKGFHYLIAVLSFLPFLLWRLHLVAHPEGSFASGWLLNDGHIRFTGAFFRWIIFERLNRLIFATGGFVLFVIGIFRSYLNKKGSLIFIWLLSVALYFAIFAKGNVNHDYYQLPVVPVGSVLVSLGFWWLVNSSRRLLPRLLNLSLAVTLLLLSFAFGWYEVRGFFNINHPEIVAAGQAADRSLPSNALVIAPYRGDPAFLYQTNRHGWPIGGDIDDKIARGAQYYVTTTFDDEFAQLKEKFTLLEQTDSYAIIKLSPHRREPTSKH